MKKVFMFSGQGSQYVGMGKELYDNYPEARTVFEKANEVLGYRISDIIFSDEEKLNDTLYTQVAMFTLYVAIVEVLKEKGVMPDYTIGLSLGEYGALYCQGVFNFETGLKILEKRGFYMNQASMENPGKMSAILGLEANIIEEIIAKSNDYVTVANYNTYGQIVISGSEKGVLFVNELALENGAKRAIMLNTSGAFHSQLMKEASEQFRGYLDSVILREPRKSLLLNTTGDYYQSNIKQSMVDQITFSVKFYQMIEKLIKDDSCLFIEIGPKNTLCSFVKKVDKTLPLFQIENSEQINKLLEY